MSSSEVFLNVEPWLFQSPELARGGQKADIGLIAEALVFYERVYFGFTGDEQFARVVAWFQSQGKTAEFISLVRDRVLVPYYYAFHTLPAMKNDVWSVLNIQDQEAASKPVFASRIMQTGRIESLVRQRSVREALVQAVLDQHVEIKAEEFGTGLNNASEDYTDPVRAAFLVQIVYDELYQALGLPQPPLIQATRHSPEPGLDRITWNCDFNEFKRKLGNDLTFHPGVPLASAAFGVKTIWSAAQLGADLYVGAPAVNYVQFKLGEGNKAARSRAIIQELIEEVAFPDIRRLVNQNEIDVATVLRLRRQASRFREWLRSESHFDRNAVIAYLGELAVEAGWTRNVKSILKAVGLFGGAGGGAALGGPLGAVGGALAGAGFQYIVDLATKLDGGWRPKVFGQAAQAEIDSVRARRGRDL